MPKPEVVEALRHATARKYAIEERDLFSVQEFSERVDQRGDGFELHLFREEG